MIYAKIRLKNLGEVMGTSAHPNEMMKAYNSQKVIGFLCLF